MQDDVDFDAFLKSSLRRSTLLQKATEPNIDARLNYDVCKRYLNQVA